MRDFLCPNCGQHLAVRELGLPILRQRDGFSLDDTALLTITPGDDSEHGGAVDSRQYQLCANLHVAECNWLVKVNPGIGAGAELLHVVQADPRPPQQRRHRSVGRVRRRREGQAAVGGRTH